jgi:hypothetical protein
MSINHANWLLIMPNGLEMYQTFTYIQGSSKIHKNLYFWFFNFHLATLQVTSTESQEAFFFESSMTMPGRTSPKAIRASAPGSGGSIGTPGPRSHTGHSTLPSSPNNGYLWVLYLPYINLNKLWMDAWLMISAYLCMYPSNRYRRTRSIIHFLIQDDLNDYKIMMSA